MSSQVRFGNPANYNTTPITRSNGDSSALEVDLLGNLLASLNTLLSGENQSQNIINVEEQFTPINIAASTVVKTVANGVSGRLGGIFVSSASATPTITVYDNASGTTNKIIDTFTPVAATMYRFPTHLYSAGIDVVISGTVSCTVFYN